MESYVKKRIRTTDPILDSSSNLNPFESLSEEILFLILDLLETNPIDRKSFSLVSRSFYSIESRHRRSLTPLRSDLLPSVLTRYPSVSHLDLTLCPRVNDTCLASVAALLRSHLKSVDLSRSKSFSHCGLHCLATNCPKLVELDVSNGTELTDASAGAIGKMGNLERLKMSRCKKVTDMGIGCIAVGCPNLKLLCLKWCLGVTDLGVGLLAVKCKKIQSLDVSYTMITRKSLSPVMQLPYLNDLALAGCLGVDDLALLNLKQECKSLEAVNISNCQHVTQAGISTILKKNPNLHQLNLSYCCSVTQSIVTGLRGISKLNSVKLDGCQVSTTGLKSIASLCNSLKELSLSKCSGVTDEGISVIVTKHRGLERIDVTCCRNITDLSLASISSTCSKLISLRMESCTKVTHLGFRSIGKLCPNLQELDLTDNDLDDEGLKAISGCTKLVSLKIGICLKITDDGLVHVGRSCPELQELDLYRSVGITDRGITEIAQGCPNLQSINLAYCTEITDASLRCLAKCPRVNTLEIRGCPRVSSAGVSAMAVGCRQLSKLDIKKCYEINDAGMLLLARYSPNLRQINLSYCSVTDVGLLALASISCLQSMTILHVTGLTANGLAAALLVCTSLTKIKLHCSFKAVVSPSIIRHVESRGCLFQWIDKPFQVEVEPSEVWKQQSHDVFVD